MDETFGSYIKQKRKEKMLKLNSFAKQIGISNVYLSYIENGKRPAPSSSVLQKITQVLSLSHAETDKLYALALLSRNRTEFPDELLSYINDHPYIIETLRIAKEKNAGYCEWASIRKMLELNTSAKHVEK